MPPQQNKQPDFIAGPPPPDFIPANQPVPETPQPEQEGPWESLGHAFGIGKQEQQDAQAHPIRSAAQLLPGVAPLEGAFSGAKRIGGEVLDAGKDAVHGNMAGAITHGVKALPFVGPAIDKAADQYADQNYGGEAGTLLGGAAQAAPALLGGIDAAAPGRTPFAEIPTRAKAGAVFQDLNKSLANQPVNLTKSTPELTQLEKVGAAGPGVPTTVGKLLDRSRMISPMNYPEARLFQENLSGPSTTEKMGMGGSMKGGVKQLNKAFYGDIYDAANQAGRGEDYAKAMTDYRRAAQLNKAFKTVGKTAAIGAAGAAGASGGYRLVKDLMQ